MFDTFPVGLILLVIAGALIFLGWGHRVLDRMRLTDTQALVILAAMVAGAFLPGIPLAPGVSVDIGGGLVPIGVAAYLIATAGTRREQSRALVASVVTAAAVFALDKILPADPGGTGLGGITVNLLDPVWLPGAVAGAVGYLAGRSRRSAFVAGILGVALTDVFALIESLIRGVPGAVFALGEAGSFDAVVIAGFLAVLLAEAFGETVEWLQGGPERKRPEPLRRGLAGESERAKDEGEPPSAVTETKTDGASTNRVGGEERAADARGVVASFTLAAFLVGGSLLAGPQVGRDGGGHLGGTVYAMYDPAGRLVMETGRRLYVGDEYIDQENRHYRVTEVEGDRALARFLGVVNLTAEGDAPDSPSLPLTDARTDADGTPQPAGRTERAAVAAERRVTVGVYHTHNDESYIPSNGKASVNGRGDIHEVGGAFTDALREEGFQAVHDQSIHLPHDAGAYRRSRRTAAELMREKGADLLFDVHRDAGPQQAYAERVNGEWVTQVRLVVGRQNPQMRENLAWAKELKGVADRSHKGLIKGIFLAHGSYNQDLTPRALLLELGTEKNARQSAERGIRAFAEVVQEWVRRNGGIR